MRYIALIFVLLFLSCQSFAAEVSFKLSAKNPSKLSNREVEIKQYLPVGVEVEHVIDAGGLDVGYDLQKHQGYVHKKINLAPGESSEFEVLIKDIWQIDISKVLKYKRHANDLLQKSSGLNLSSQAQSLKNAIVNNVKKILRRQNENTVEVADAKSHIRAYETNVRQLELLRIDVGKLENLILAAGGNPEVLLVTQSSSTGGFGGAIGAKSDISMGLMLGIVLFLGVVSGLLFLIWTIQASKLKQIEKLQLDDDSQGNRND